MSEESNFITTIVAWWGAVVATLVLVWDVYKWATSGTRLVAKASSNMLIVEPGKPQDNQHYITATVSNRGDAATTLKGVYLLSYSNWWRYLRRIPSRSFFVSTPSHTHPVPFRIEPGSEWLGHLPQTDEMEQLARSGILVLEIAHSQANKSLRKRITI